MSMWKFMCTDVHKVHIQMENKKILRNFRNKQCWMIQIFFGIMKWFWRYVLVYSSRTGDKNNVIRLCSSSFTDQVLWPVSPQFWGTRLSLHAGFLKMGGFWIIPDHTPSSQWVPGALSVGVKRPGREADHTSPSSAEVKECVELYLHSPNTPSWPGS